MDELLHLSGYRNLAAELGIPAYGRLPLEAVLAGRPDLLVLDGNANANPARATEFVDHNALLALAGSTRLVSIPLKYTVCAGPENFEALKLLRRGAAMNRGLVALVLVLYLISPGRRPGAVALAPGQRGRLGDRLGAARAARHARPADRRRARPQRRHPAGLAAAIRWPSPA